MKAPSRRRIERSHRFYAIGTGDAENISVLFRVVAAVVGIAACSCFKTDQGRSLPS